MSLRDAHSILSSSSHEFLNARLHGTVRKLELCCEALERLSNASVEEIFREVTSLGLGLSGIETANHQICIELACAEELRRIGLLCSGSLQQYYRSFGHHYSYRNICMAILEWFTGVRDKEMRHYVLLSEGEKEAYINAFRCMDSADFIRALPTNGLDFGTIRSVALSYFASGDGDVMRQAFQRITFQEREAACESMSSAFKRVAVELLAQERKYGLGAKMYSGARRVFRDVSEECAGLLAYPYMLTGVMVRLRKLVDSSRLGLARRVE